MDPFKSNNMLSFMVRTSGVVQAYHVSASKLEANCWNKVVTSNMGDPK